MAIDSDTIHFKIPNNNINIIIDWIISHEAMRGDLLVGQ